MKELVKISKQEIGNEEVNAVDARELWKALESKQQYADWIKKRIENLQLIENVDFVTIHKVMKRENSSGASKRIDYILTLDSAKHIAMAERNEMGKKVRIYFIEAEKKLRQLNLPNFTNPVIAARAWADELEKKQIAEAKVKELAPKADYFDALVDADLNTGIRDTAKELNLGQKEFVNKLLDNSFIFRTNEGVLRPYMQYNNDLFVLKERVNKENGWSGLQLLVTPKGKATFRLLFANNNQTSFL